MTTFFIDTSKSRPRRFDLAKFLEDVGGGQRDILTSFLIKEIPKLDRFDTHRVIFDEVNKFSLISHRRYGDNQYWWILQEYNDILDYRDLVEGLVINLFDLNSLESLFFRLKSLSETQS